MKIYIFTMFWSNQKYFVVAENDHDACYAFNWNRDDFTIKVNNVSLSNGFLATFQKYPFEKDKRYG